MTCVASPSNTRSMPLSETEMLAAGFAARFLDLRVSEPLVKYSWPSCHSAPTPAACGLPSGVVVPRIVGADHVGGDVRGRDHGGLLAPSVIRVSTRWLTVG